MSSRTALQPFWHNLSMQPSTWELRIARKTLLGKNLSIIPEATAVTEPLPRTLDGGRSRQTLIA